MRVRWWFGFLCAVLLRGQAPVVEARGIVNGVTFELAPSTVAPGGIFNIYGFNLAPATLSAAAVPLPVSLGSPAVEVTVNGRSAPLYFVSSTQINTQMPWETEPGAAQVVVKRGGVSSRPATIVVQPVAPSLFALNGAGFGSAIAVRAANGGLVSRDNPPLPGDVLVLYASGLGPVEPAVSNGAAGPAGPLARVARNQRAFVGGFPANVLFAGLAPGFVGLFQINLRAPELAAEGDVLQYFSGPQMANRLTLGSPASPRVRFLPLPEGTAALSGIVDTDLNGGFVAINGPRGEDGCYRNPYILDFRRNQTTPIGECLVAPGANAPSPFVTENEAARVAALVGPPVGSPPAGISSKVLILDAATGDKTIVELPAPASSLIAGAPGVQGGRGLLAVMPGDPPRVALINGETGEVQVGQGGVAAGAGTGGGTTVNVDDLTRVVTVPLRLAGNRTALIVADEETNPTRALFVVLSPTGDVSVKIELPGGYVPLIPPRPQAPGGGGGVPPRPGGDGQPGGGQGPAPRASMVNDQGRIIALVRSSGGARHALAIFDVEGASGRALDFPAPLYAAACSPNIQLLNLALGRKVALPVSDRLETEATNPCAATGLLILDLATTSVTRVTLPGSGALEVNSVRVLNSYLYGANAERVNQQNAFSLFVYDPTNETMRKLDTPRGATGFGGALQPITATNQLLALAANRAAGDEGLILFDLGKGSAQLFPAPDGFVRVANPGVQPVTRKLTARGIKAGSDGSQILVFDPGTGAVTVLPNPPQVRAVGAPATAGAQARIVWQRNPNSNTVLAAAFAGEDRPIGLVLVEAP